MGSLHLFVQIFILGCIFNFHQLNALYISSSLPIDPKNSIEFTHSIYRTKDEWSSWSGLALPYDRSLGLNLTSRGCIISQIPGNTDTRLIERCIEEGASAAITIIPFSDEPGFASWRHLNKKYGIPAVDLSRLAQDELRERLLKKEPVFISFSKEDEKNQWYDALKSGVMIWFSVSLSIIAATNIVLSLWRLINYIRKYGVSYSLSQTIMGICLASNIINLINVSIDPIYSRNIFGFMVSSLLLTLTYPVTLITTLLITLYWHEIMTINSAKVYINLKRKVFIIPLITVSVILFFLQIGGSISRGLRFNANTLISVNAICFIIFLTTINSYCLVIGCLIKKKIKKSAGVSRKSNRRSKLLHVTNYIMISSLSTFLALPFFVIIITNIFRIPYMFIVTLYFIYFFLFISDTIKILAFGLPTTSITSTKRSSKSEDVSSQLNRSNTS